MRTRIKTRTVKITPEFVAACAWCKKVRDTIGRWAKIEHGHETVFTHGICPECKASFYSEMDEAKAQL